MATITLRIDDAVRDQLQSLADGRNISISELLREAIDGLFDKDTRRETRRSVVPESMNATTRLQLALLHRILARLVEPHDADDRKVRDRLSEDGDTAHQLDLAEIVESGWTMEYDDSFARITPELSRRDCGLTMDILDMFSVLRRSVRALDNGMQGDFEHRLAFRGFDVNDSFEVRLLGYARSVIDGGRWEDLADVFSSKNDYGNSHFPLLASYRRMLATFDPIWQPIVYGRGRPDYTLKLAELEQVAEAAVHPDNRDI